MKTNLSAAGGGGNGRLLQPVFDGHNDLLLRLWLRSRSGGDPVEMFRAATSGHIDMKRAAAGGLAGGLCAMFVPSADGGPRQRGTDGSYATPLALPLDRREALEATLAMTAIAIRLEQEGCWRLCRSTAEIDAAAADGMFAAVLHVEGCEAIGPDLDALHVFHAAGLRSLGPVWSRNNIFGHGVPFSFPASPDSGPGLTEEGRALVRECNRLGILVDLSHLTEQGFWDVAAVTDKPLVASHSNAHALVPVARNLTDRQLDAIRETGGLVGLNFAVTMLREDGRADTRTPVSVLVRHIDHLVDRLGIDGVALGSDFDGALMPAEIRDAAGLPVLVDALAAAGYSANDLERICRSNWLRILADTWHESAIEALPELDGVQA